MFLPVCVCIVMNVHVCAWECVFVQNAGKFAAHMDVSSAHNGNTIVCTLSFQFQLFARNRDRDRARRNARRLGAWRQLECPGES